MRTRNNFFTAIFPAFLLAALLFSGCPAATDDGNRDTGVSFPAPTGLLAELSGNSVTVTWNPVRDAAAYEFYFAQREDDTAAASYYQDTEDPVFTMESLGRGVVHYFWVKAKKADGETSPFSAPASAVVPVLPPTEIRVNKDTASLHVTWDPAEGAAAYEVYVSEMYNPPSSPYTVQEGTYTEITGRGENKSYWIRLKSRYPGGLSDFSEPVQGTTGEPEQPGMPNFYGIAELDGGRIDIFWRAATNATHYQLYFGTSLREMNENSKTVYGTSHRLEGLTDGTTYHIAMMAWAGARKSSAMTAPATAVPGGRLPEELLGTFFSRYPYDRPYYMDGHQIGWVRDMKKDFPFNVAGRPSAIGPSPGRYTPSSDPYPRPGYFGGSIGPVMPSGYTLNDDRDQYVMYIGVMNASYFGVIRAVARSIVAPATGYTVIFENGSGRQPGTNGYAKYYVMRFSKQGSHSPLPSTGCDFYYGLTQTSQSGFASWELSTEQIYNIWYNFYDAGVAYPAIKLGTYYGEPSSLINPLLIEKGPAARAVSALSAQGITLPGGLYSGNWWQRWWSRDAVVTEMGEEATDAIVSAFWNEIQW